ncbi:MAG: hypothetical protein GY862_04955 [Gammaproteobacteria bacterium]|nr:hypothetical protein [Gammaproteobacteria bacterium]
MKDKLKKPIYIIAAIVVLYLAYRISTNIVWFLLQTLIYGALIMVLLIFLKKKGFFK